MGRREAAVMGIRDEHVKMRAGHDGLSFAHAQTPHDEEYFSHLKTGPGIITTHFHPLPYETELPSSCA